MSLFTSYRLLLVLTVVCYSVVSLTVWIWRHWPRWVEPSRRGRLLRRYSVTMLAGIRWVRFWPDLLQIAILVVALACLVGLHH